MTFVVATTAFKTAQKSSDFLGPLVKKALRGLKTKALESLVAARLDILKVEVEAQGRVQRAVWCPLKKIVKLARCFRRGMDTAELGR